MKALLQVAAIVVIGVACFFLALAGIAFVTRHLGIIWGVVASIVVVPAFVLSPYLILWLRSPKDWIYMDYDDVYATNNNLRYSPSTGIWEILDVDGWCHDMPKEEACRTYGMTPEAWDAADRKFRSFLNKELRSRGMPGIKNI